MLYLENLEDQKLFTELSPEESANINGGKGDESDDNGEGKFGASRYLKALGIAYLSPPKVGEVTDDEALLAQYIGWKD
ncbi:hypothetical protein NIES4074_55220 [Cylindrospermum sp. NIES-4074]|nr:hypothetical protein NIES4074_55220 [Cylindrospermum sp. NIES-4074]